MSWTVQWVSPLRDDQWAEYRDAAFLAKVEAGHLSSQLAEFWPEHGPQWDALGKSSDKGVVLVEAKSHLEELTSSCQASDGSLPKIRASLAAAKDRFQAAVAADWLTGYYQYANRLAHLHFLQSHGVPAHLAFVYFIKDHEMKGPASVLEWKQQLSTVYSALGLGNEDLPGVCNVFIDVADFPPSILA